LSIAIIFISLISCNEKKEKINPSENALLNLENRFPGFPKGEKRQTDLYKLIRRVMLGDSFSIEQRSRRGEDNYYNYPCDTAILIFSIANGKSYAVPLLTEGSADYWNFRFDNFTHQKIKRTNTTFENEIILAFQSLDADTSPFAARKNIHELFTKIMGCSKMNKRDSTEILSYDLYVDRDRNFSCENGDTCKIRYRKSWEEMLSSLSHNNFEDIFWDKNSGIIYSVDYNKEEKSKHYLRAIRVYRLNCPCMFYLDNG